MLTPTVLRLSPSWISCVCVLLVFVVCFWKSTNSTVVDRELTPWFFWSVASGDFIGVLLESVMVIVMVWIDVFFLWKGRSAGGTTLFYGPSRTGLAISCFLCCGPRTLSGLWVKNIYKVFNEVHDSISLKISCTDRCQYLLAIAISSTFFGIEGMAKFILDVKFSMYRENECHVERGCGSLYPLWGTT